MASTSNTARNELANRRLPEMTLSDGSASSMTPPTPALPENLTSEQKALARFAVKGNAVSMLGTATPC